MLNKLFIGVDGGATKCTVRVEDESGTLIGQATSGPANIRLSVDQAWASINAALSQLLPRSDQFELHAGMGLAGCEIDEAKQAFTNHPHSFASLQIASDAHTACLGAHAGRDGAIIIIGTGVVGLKCEQAAVTAKVGGWGFPHDDLGGGAWLGLEAVKVALQVMDGRLPDSRLAEAIYQHFQNDKQYLVNWANAANSTQFAQLAPVVVSLSKQGDATSIQIMQRAASEIDRVATALSLGDLPCALIGGVAPHMALYLSDALRARLHAAKMPPEVGGILLARQRRLVVPA